VALFLIAFAGAPSSTESAIANGDTRSLSLTNSHTNEAGTFTYMVNGAYDKSTLDKLNWFLRDWRLNEQTQMDPKLFDILWEVYRESGSQQPVDVLSAYRSPQTNAMLRRRSRQVAKYSQHMEGKAIDAHFIDVTTATIRDIAMRMQSGGVGFYPSGITPWVHVDSGAVRYWPRMSRDALARLFPDGKTVFIPSDGKPMAGYDLAAAEIQARGGNVIPQSNTWGGGLFAWLFGGPHGGGADDAEDSGEDAVAVASVGGRGRAGGQALLASRTLDDAKLNLPHGETVAQAAPAKAGNGDDSDAGGSAAPITLRGPIAGQFIAPLPPPRPSEFSKLALADAPVPPRRPAEGETTPVAFAVAAAESKAVVAPANRDLIVALLKRAKAPGVITRGLGDAPNDVLALTETTDSAERPEALAAAARLVAPPLPPLRPSDLDDDAGSSEGTMKARKSHATPPPRLNREPFGALVTDAFSAAPASEATTLKLRALASAN
jgi:uncharacterized protein YcbK (DUF882 family)